MVGINWSVTAPQPTFARSLTQHNIRCCRYDSLFSELNELLQQSLIHAINILNYLPLDIPYPAEHLFIK
jgi:hypothetical protein